MHRAEPTKLVRMMPVADLSDQQGAKVADRNGKVAAVRP